MELRKCCDTNQVLVLVKRGNCVPQGHGFNSKGLHKLKQHTPCNAVYITLDKSTCRMPKCKYIRTLKRLYNLFRYKFRLKCHVSGCF